MLGRAVQAARCEITLAHRRGELSPDRRCAPAHITKVDPAGDPELGQNPVSVNFNGARGDTERPPRLLEGDIRQRWELPTLAPHL